MHLFGIPINDICQSLVKYQSPTHWCAELFQEILKDEYYVGCQFISEIDKVAVMQVCDVIIPKKVYVAVQRLDDTDEILPANERIERLGNALL